MYLHNRKGLTKKTKKGNWKCQWWCMKKKRDDPSFFFKTPRTGGYTKPTNSRMLEHRLLFLFVRKPRPAAVYVYVNVIFTLT